MRFLKDVFKAFALAVMLCMAAPAAYAQTGCIPEKPSFQTSVYDYAGIFSPAQKDALERKLIAYSDTTSTQIVVASTKDLCGGDIGMTAIEWAHKWGIGQKGKDNGIFVLVSPNDRKIFIATGYGTEGSLTDAMTRRIIETRILPEFRKGDYYAGIDAGVDGIFQVLTGEFKADPKSDGDGDSLLILLPIIIFVVVMIAAFSSKKGNNGGGEGNGGGGRKSAAADALLTGILLGSMGRRSGGGFGGGGFGGGSGGFGGGFGGGGFGGGGAGGSW